MTNDEIEQALEQMKISIAEIEKQLGVNIANQNGGTPRNGS